MRTWRAGRNRWRSGPLIQTDRIPQVVAADDLRSAFSRTDSPHAAELLLRALDAGMGWETATHAVAQGIAERFPPVSPLARPSSMLATLKRMWSGLAFGFILYLLTQPVLGLIRESLVAAFALTLRSFIATGIWQPILTGLRLDPVYAGAALRSLGSVQVSGIAIAGPLGVLLHARLPDIFLAPDQTRSGAFASMVALPGASILGQMAAAVGADVVLLTMGFILMRRASGRTSLQVYGLFVQAEIVIGHVLRASLGARQLDASGVPFALALVSPMLGWRSTERLAALPEPWQTAILSLALVMLAYAVPVLGLLGIRVIGRKAPKASVPAERHDRLPRRAFAACAIATVMTVWSPIGSLARSASNWQPVNQVVNAASANRGSNQPASSSAADSGPRVVSLVQRPTGAWEYLVDGSPTVIRGVGYNPQYAALPASQRAILYQRDFSAIQSIGANSIEGWFDNQFDEMTLDYANRYGLGVIMPFELNQDWDYSDPTVQTDVLSQVGDWVMRYRANPAVRMWAPGNENLHHQLYANWVSQEQVPAARAKAQAFAAFLPRLVDRIHELDPDHPVLYRDAEDVYLDWLKQGFDSSPTPRPWLVYGANVYSATRLSQIIAAWPTQWVGGPLVISEFAPGGRGPDARASGYQQDWQVIRSRPAVVLGGLAYTWATNGPEDLDRVFGLVDANGNPCDAAMSALAAAYLNDQSAAESPMVVRADNG